jgi:hypothetical protein
MKALITETAQGQFYLYVSFPAKRLTTKIDVWRGFSANSSILNCPKDRTGPYLYVNNNELHDSSIASSNKTTF